FESITDTLISFMPVGTNGVYTCGILVKLMAVPRFTVCKGVPSPQSMLRAKVSPVPVSVNDPMRFTVPPPSGNEPTSVVKVFHTGTAGTQRSSNRSRPKRDERPDRNRPRGDK